MFTETSNKMLDSQCRDIQATLKVLLTSAHASADELSTGAGHALRARVVAAVDGGGLNDLFEDERLILQLAELGLCEMMHVAVLAEMKKRGLPLPGLREGT